MFERFEDAAKASMSRARKLAHELRQEWIGTEHVLLGMLDAGTGAALRVLDALAVDREALRADVFAKAQARVGPLRESVSMDQLPFTTRSKRMLEAALEQAADLRHVHVGTEHLLLGLIAEHESLVIGQQEGIAGAALHRAGLALAAVRAAVTQIHGAAAPAATEPSRPATPPKPPKPPRPPIGDVLIQSENRGSPGPDWLPCEGQSLPHADYAALFAILQQRFGVAADETAFRLPDYRGLFATVTPAGGVRALRFDAEREREEGTTRPLRFWVRVR